MSDTPGKRTKTAWLAKTHRHDIQERSLREGDQYLTAAEVSRQFDVSPMMVHRAMSILAERKERDSPGEALARRRHAQRWCVAASMRAENKFHHVKGYGHM